jgi:hypothetical protein
LFFCTRRFHGIKGFPGHETNIEFAKYSFSYLKKKFEMPSIKYKYYFTHLKTLSNAFITELLRALKLNRIILLMKKIFKRKCVLKKTKQNISWYNYLNNLTYIDFDLKMKVQFCYRHSESAWFRFLCFRLSVCSFAIPTLCSWLCDFFLFLFLFLTLWIWLCDCCSGQIFNSWAHLPSWISKTCGGIAKKIRESFQPKSYKQK